MKDTDISENIGRYQQLTYKYKAKNRSKCENESVSEWEVPYRRCRSLSRGRSRTRDVRVYESDNEVNYECENYVGEQNVGGNKMFRVEHAQEGHSRYRGRLQLRLKKVKEYETDIAVETFSEYSVRTQKKWRQKEWTASNSHTKYSKSKARSKEEKDSEAGEQMNGESVNKCWKDDFGIFGCEFCTKIFSSDEALENHYMTHFTTVQGLNTFLNKRHQQKRSKSKEICSSILKQSRRYSSAVKKKVVFELDLSEDVNCKSQGMNSCEIIDLLEHEKNFERVKLKHNLNELEEMPKKAKVKESKGGTDSNVVVKIPNSGESQLSAGKVKANTFLGSFGSENIYCSHDLDLAKSCINNAVRVTLSPLKSNEKGEAAAVSRCKQEESSVKELWSVAKSFVKRKSKKKVDPAYRTRKRKVVKKGEKGSLKLTLSKHVVTWKKGIDSCMVKKATEEVKNRKVEKGNEHDETGDRKVEEGDKNNLDDIDINKKKLNKNLKRIQNCQPRKVCSSKLKLRSRKKETKGRAKCAGITGKMKVDKQKDLPEIASNNSTDQNDNDQGNVFSEKLKKNENCKLLDNTLKVTSEVWQRQLGKTFESSSEDSCTVDKSTDEIMLGLGKDSLCSDNKVKENQAERSSRKLEIQGKLEKMQAYIVSKKDYFARGDTDIWTRKECHYPDNYVNSMLNEELAFFEQEQLKRNRENEENDFYQYNKISHVLNLDIENERPSFFGNDPDLFNPDCNNNERFYDSCHDEVLIKFASDLDIVLNSPENAALIFDENALYKNLETISAKELLDCEYAIETANTYVKAENADNLSAQMLMDARQPENCHDLQSFNYCRESIKDNNEKNEESVTLVSGEHMPVSPDAILECMTIIGISPKEEKQESEKIINSPLNDETYKSSDTKTRFLEHAQSEKIESVVNFEHNSKYEVDTVSKFDENQNVEMQSRFNKTDIEEITQDRDMKECMQAEREREGMTSSKNTEKVEGNHIEDCKRVLVRSNVDCHEQIAEVQCVRKDEKVESTAQSSLNDEYEKEHTDSKINLKKKLDIHSRDDVSVEIKKQSPKNEEIHEETDARQFDKSEKNLFHRIENVKAETDIHISGKGEGHGKLKVEENKIQMKKSHSCEDEMSDGFNKLQRQSSSSKQKKRKLNHAFETHTHRKMKKIEDVNNNNFVEVIDLTQSEEETSVQDTEQAVLRSQDRMAKPCVKSPEQNKDQLEKSKWHVPFNKFYRCEKCNKVFHAVADLDLNSCKKCVETVSENSGSFKPNKDLKENRVNDRTDCTKGNVDMLECVKAAQLKDGGEVKTVKPASVISDINKKYSPDDDIVETKESLKVKQISSPGKAVENKGLKLVFRKVKMPTVRSDNNRSELTGSSEQLQWKVKDFVTVDSQGKHGLEYSNVDNDSKGNSLETNEFDANNNFKEQIAECSNTENGLEQKNERQAESLTLPKEKKGENVKDSFRTLDAENCKNEINAKHENIENLVNTRKSARVESKHKKVDCAKTKIDCQEELNEFEKALLIGNGSKKKDKTKKKDIKDKKKLGCSQNSSEKILVEDNKTLLTKRRNYRPLGSNSDAVQPFQKSKIAQMIYSKKQRETYDGLPDFSTKKIDLGSLQPLSVSTSNKGSDTCSKISDDSSCSGLNTVTETICPVTTGITFVSTAPSFNSVSVAAGFRNDFETAVTYTRNKMTRIGDVSTCHEYDFSTASGNSNFKEAVGFKMYKPMNGLHNIKTDNKAVNNSKVDMTKKKDAKDFKELKKELEAIGIAKDVSLKNLMGSFTCGSAFSPPWNSKKTDTFMNNSQPALPSFSDTFSKNKLLPQPKNHTFASVTDFNTMSESSESSKTSESSKSRNISETESSFNDDYDDDTGFEELNGNKSYEVGKLPVNSVFNRLGKRKMSEDSESAVLSMQGSLKSPANVTRLSTWASPVRPESIETKLVRNARNFSSTPAVKSLSGNLLSTPQCSELNISQISMSSSVKGETSCIARPKRRRIKRLEVQEYQSDRTDGHKNSNILQDSQMSPMLIISADCSKIDMTGLSGPSIDTAAEHSLYNNLQYTSSLVKEPWKGYSFQTIKTEDDISERKQVETVEGFSDDKSYQMQFETKTNDTERNDDTAKFQECLLIDREARNQDETLLDYEDDHSYRGLFSLDSCDNTVVEENDDAFTAVTESDRIVENTGSDNSLRITLGNKDCKKIGRSMDSGIVCVDEGVRESEKASEATTRKSNVSVLPKKNILRGFSDVSKEINCSQSDLKRQIKKESTDETEIISSVSPYDKKVNEEDKFDKMIELQEDREQENEVNTSSENLQGDNNSQSNSSDEDIKIDPDLEREQKNRSTGADTGDHCIKQSKDDSPRDGAEEVMDDVLVKAEVMDDVLVKVEGMDDVLESAEDIMDDVLESAEEVMDDVLDIYASDEEATFLFDSPLPYHHPKSPNKASAPLKIEDKCEVEDMELEAAFSESGSPTIKTNFPVTSPALNIQQNLSAFWPMRSNPIKGRWMPRGWCFRYFSRNTCSPQCMFRHDNPTEDVLRRCMVEVTEKCKKGELDSAMNMLMSQQYFMDNISQEDLDCLFGYSINNLKIEYCHKLMLLISSRDLINQGHIDDIVFLWKRLMHSKDIEVLRDAFFIAKQKKILPQQMASLVLLEAFSTYGDMYILWNLIIYCTQNENLVISQPYINRAVSLAVCSSDVSLLSPVVAWLETATHEQLVHINIEVLQALKNRLQQMNLVKLVTSVHQWLVKKTQIAGGAGLKSGPKVPGQQLPQTVNHIASVCDPSAFGQQTDSQLVSMQNRSRAATPSILDFRNVGQHNRQHIVTPTATSLTQSHALISTYKDLDSVKRAGQNNLPRCSNLWSMPENDTADLGKGVGQQLSQLFTSRLKSRTSNTLNLNKTGHVMLNEYQSMSQPGHVRSRPVTPSDFDATHLASRTSNELPVCGMNLMEQLKAVSQGSNLQSLADLYMSCCQSGPPPPEVFEQVLFALTKHDNSVGKAWEDFILYIKQKQTEAPGMRLNKYSLSVLGSEIFYTCYSRGSLDAKDILLVILDTDFLTLSPSVGQRLGVCLELVAAEFLSEIGLPVKAAQILLEMSPKQRLEVDVKSRFLSFLQPLVLRLCTEGERVLAFQIFCMATRWNYKGLRRIASELIQSCLQVQNVDIPVQIFRLYLTDERQFDVWDTVKRSLLNALVATKMEYCKRLYEDVRQDASASLYLQQSFQKPRCIWLQLHHTYNEIKLIVGEYLQDMYNVLCDQMAKNVPLTVQDLSLDVAVDTQTSHPDQSELPYVGPGKASLSNIKQLLLPSLGFWVRCRVKVS